jgi:YHS domain-containing protein
MKLNWKWTAANVLLLAMIGCNGGDEPAAAPAGGQGGAAPIVKPGAPTASKPESNKGDLPSAAAPAGNKTESKADDGPKLDGPKADNSKSTDAASSLTEKELAAIKQLPEAEQAIALKQRVCPVSGGTLGAMGKPYQVTYEGRSFYLCCKDCEGDVKADPKAFIAKLDKKDDKK